MFEHVCESGRSLFQVSFRFHPIQCLRALMFKKSGAVLTKDISRYFISLQLGKFIGKPLIQLNAECFDLGLLKQRMSFSEAPE